VECAVDVCFEEVSDLVEPFQSLEFVVRPVEVEFRYDKEGKTDIDCNVLVLREADVVSGELLADDTGAMMEYCKDCSDLNAVSRTRRLEARVSEGRYEVYENTQLDGDDWGNICQVQRCQEARDQDGKSRRENVYRKAKKWYPRFIVENMRCDVAMMEKYRFGGR
jgi:hypothetical protein